MRWTLDSEFSDPLADDRTGGRRHVIALTAWSDRLDRVWNRLAIDPDKPVAVWYAGCSTGEALYAFTLALLSRLDRRKSPLVSVYATDVSPLAIDVARAGTYHVNAVAEVPGSTRARYFDAMDGGGLVRVTASVRDRLQFALWDPLLSRPVARQFDIIVCESVMETLGPPLRQRLLYTFERHLATRGHLFVADHAIAGLDHGLSVVGSGVFQQ